VTTEPPPRPAIDQQKLALDRTFLAHERTMMAWIRTGTSLITFGFTLYKFFDYLREQGTIHEPRHLLGTRTIGLLMVAMGVFTIAIAGWQHRQNLKQLGPLYEKMPFSLSSVIAALIAGLGILAILSALVRI
jgi:putative membrane protein